jgi:hypothetical protein
MLQKSGPFLSSGVRRERLLGYSLDNSSNSNANNNHQAENKNNSQYIKLVIVTQISGNILVSTLCTNV